MKGKFVCLLSIMAMASAAWGNTTWTGANNSQWGDAGNWTSPPTVYGQWFIVDNTDGLPNTPEWDATVPNGVRGLAVAADTPGNAYMAVTDANHGVGDLGLSVGGAGTGVVDINAQFHVGSSDQGFGGGNVVLGYQDGGVGTVNVNAELNNNSRWQIIGSADGGTGTLNVNTGGSVLTHRGYIGDNGTGTLNVGGGIYHTTDTISVGTQVTGGGTISVFNGGHIYASGHVTIAERSSASVNVSDGGLFEIDPTAGGKDIYLGEDKDLVNAVGTVNVHDGGIFRTSTVTNQSDLFLGSATGEGIINIYGGHVYARRDPIFNNGSIRLLDYDGVMIFRAAPTSLLDIQTWIGEGKIQGIGGDTNLANFEIDQVQGSTIDPAYTTSVRTVMYVPEPATLMLLALGALLLLMWRRRNLLPF